MYVVETSADSSRVDDLKTYLFNSMHGPDLSILANLREVPCFTMNHLQDGA